LAYVSDESGKFEVYVTAFPSPGRKWQVSNGAGAPTTVAWSMDGKELYFTGQGKLMSVPVQNADNFEFGTPAELPIRTRDVEDFTAGSNPDQLVVLKHTGDSQGPPMQVVLNWTQRIKK
jgi:Tol biopolymer transport system component